MGVGAPFDCQWLLLEFVAFFPRGTIVSPSGCGCVLHQNHVACTPAFCFLILVGNGQSLLVVQQYN